MTALVKPLLLSAFAAGSLAVAGGQPEPPPRPPVAPVAPVPPLPFAGPAVVNTADGVTTVYGGQGGGFGGSYYSARSFAPFGDDPNVRELVKKLAGSNRDTESAAEQQDKLRADLKAALAKAFDDRLKGQEQQVAELEKQLKRLKEMVGKRKEAKSEIVADRLAALEKEAKGLGW